MDLDKRLATRPRRTVAIPADIDHRYRDGLHKAAKTVSPRVAWYVRKSLDNGPSRGGYPEAVAYFGPALIALLAPTAPIIDMLEVAMPGFKQWLEATGFADDKTMIQAFLVWSETQLRLSTQAESVIPAVRH